MKEILIYAKHPHWFGNIKLIPEEHIAIHMGIASKGLYEIRGNKLTINWYNYEKDIFIRAEEGIYFSDKLSIYQIEEFRFVRWNDLVFPVGKVSVRLPTQNYQLSIRVGSTDELTFRQVFVNNQYAIPDLPESVETIVDLGANVGYATVFFGLKYPRARIRSVEPDVDNYAALVENSNPLGPRLCTTRAAVWVNDGLIGVTKEDDDGGLLGEWGVRVSSKEQTADRLVPSFRLDTLLSRSKFTKVDVLKIDIEGSEYELFSDRESKWLDVTDLIIVETHDRFRPGSEGAVRIALKDRFVELPRSGEYLVFRRNS